MTPQEKFKRTGSLSFSHSTSTASDKKVAVGLTKTTESPYLAKKNTQNLELSLVNAEKSRFIKQVVMLTLILIPECDLDVNTYQNQLLRTNKPQQQSNNFSFPTLENPGKTENLTPIQTRISRELQDLKEEKKLNPQNDTESEFKFH